jgi:hypothetical protein
MALGHTQRITAVDIRNGRIRVPHDSKGLFPDHREYVRVNLRGHGLRSRWDPRFGPDQERSGVLGIGRRVLPDLVQADEILTITRDADGLMRLS